MATPPDDRVIAWFREQLAKIAEPPRDPAGVRVTDNLREDLGVDSLAFIELMVDFEEAFGLRLDEGDLLGERYCTVGDLVSHMTGYLAQACEVVED
jgi:acyl carrier protein